MLRRVESLGTYIVLCASRYSDTSRTQDPSPKLLRLYDHPIGQRGFSCHVGGEKTNSCDAPARKQERPTRASEGLWGREKVYALNYAHILRGRDEQLGTYVVHSDLSVLTGGSCQ